jgi:hypothetical protein
MYIRLQVYNTLECFYLGDNQPIYNVVQNCNRYIDQSHRNYTVEDHLVETTPRDYKWPGVLRFVRITNPSAYRTKLHTEKYPKGGWTTREPPKRCNRVVHISIGELQSTTGSTRDWYV